MQHNEDMVSVLNDLIRINNDRINGYEKAITETKDADDDLKSVFRRMADESRQHKSELIVEVKKQAANQWKMLPPLPARSIAPGWM